MMSETDTFKSRLKTTYVRNVSKLKIRKKTMSSNDRKQIRNAFNLLKDNDESIHLKDYLITMCPNITETKFDDEDILKNRIRMINAIVNRRFLKKKYKTRTDRIMFHNFIENSYNKNLIHTHSIIRIPRFLLERVKEVFKYLKHIVVNKFYFSIRITKRLNRATRYMTKHYHENNDRYFVN